jgi:enamine deaminase RidA (YjgF/YER057c/UK114 family)
MKVPRCVRDARARAAILHQNSFQAFHFHHKKGRGRSYDMTRRSRCAKRKQVVGGDYISRGRKLSLSKAVRAGDFVYLTGQIPREGD